MLFDEGQYQYVYELEVDEELVENLLLLEVIDEIVAYNEIEIN